MQAVTTTPNSSSLAQVVCAWQPSKLPELAKTFSDSCSPPEVSFSSYDSYKAYFEPLLLAEVAAELLSASEKYQRTTPVRHTKVRARREEPGTTAALVTVRKVTRHHTLGFGWSVDLESHDRKGPVGSVDNDVVALWPATPLQTQPRQKQGRPSPASQSRQIPNTAVLAVVLRTTTRSGCRLVLSKFPDGNEHGVRTDLEEGEENEEEPPAVRLWNVLRLGCLTTMKREFHALQKIRTSVLLPTLLRPKLQPVASSAREGHETGTKPGVAVSDGKKTSGPESSQQPKFRNEQVFTHVVANKTGLNQSQARAIMHASTCRNGFSVIQGPPGTGKTRTLISLLNVIHMTQYQEYYECLLASLEPLHGANPKDRESVKDGNGAREKRRSSTDKASDGSLLQTMMVAMNKTLSTSSNDQKVIQVPKRARRPRLLICAPSNSAVDEILTRLTRCKFVDGQGREYCPELARIGAGDRVSEAAKPFTAEGQAEAFLDRVCAEDMSAEAQNKAQMSFLNTWQNRCNTLLVQLERTPKKQSLSRPIIIDLHEKLERMDRDLRRLSIAASDGSKALSREEKLRQIARTYVEDAQLVFATLSGSASSILTKKGSNDMTGAEGTLFDTVVIDEGAQATETSCLIPMTLGASRCLLVGDPQQLPATVLSSGAAGLAYGQSLLERVCRGGQSVQLLDTQYRMHPAISSFPRRYFYNGRLVDDESVQGEHRARPYHRDAIRPKLGPYVFLDISEGEERRSRDERSIFNRAEAELASLIYSKLKKEYPKDPLFSSAAKVPGSVTGFGVVTPYKRQMQELRQSFDRAGVPTGDVEVDTVDSFQGREKDVIIFSCVRTAALNRGIGFVRDVRRMNVGLTRARSSLIILGSAQALSEGSADWAELVEDANSRGCLISVSNVHRCLHPQPATIRPLLTAGDGMQTEEETPSRGAEFMRSSARGYSTAAQRNVLGSGRTDPRRRAARRESVVESKVESSSGTVLPNASIGLRSSDTVLPFRAVGKQEPESRSIPTEAAPAIGNVGVPDLDAGAAGSTKATVISDEKNSGLQSTLKQMTRLLYEAGFQNTKAVEETLKEHIRNGGALDLETVMAAAIATNNANAAQSSKETKTDTPDSQATASESGLVSNVATLEDKSKKEQSNKSAPVEPERRSVHQERTLVISAPNVSSSTEKVNAEHPERMFKARNGAGPDRTAKSTGKSSGKQKSQGKKRECSENQAPSGWDMLFAKKNDDIGAEDIAKRGTVAAGNASNARSEKESIAKGAGHASNTNQKQSPGAERPDETRVKDEDDSRDFAHPVGERVNLPDNSDAKKQNGKDVSEVGGSKARKNWNEKGREFDRKRPRMSDYNVGRGGLRNERGRNRMKRGRGRGGLAHEGNLHDRFANESWAHAPYESGFAPYPMMGNGMDQGMGPNPHAMNPMQAMQHQAMQQQMMHQHVLQQQAQALHQQAFQQQVMQQQALQQQEAFRQQAVLMQMSAAGVPTGAVPPNPYPVVDFGGLNSGALAGSAPNQRSGSWSHGGNGGRGRGRGRGRMKYSGRNRRGV